MAIGPISGSGAAASLCRRRRTAADGVPLPCERLLPLALCRGGPERLLIAPIDLAPPTRQRRSASMAGRFVFSGTGRRRRRTSIFDAAPRSEDGRANSTASAGFATCAPRHGDPRSNARSLFDESIRVSGRTDPAAWETGVVARRVIAWLDPDAAHPRRLRRHLLPPLHAVADPAGSLPRRTAYDGPQGLPGSASSPRSRGGAVDVGAAALPATGDQTARPRTRPPILPDGGHVSRNPAILDSSMDFLPLRQAFAARGSQPSRISSRRSIG